jgi:pimeloyl-ACP methyl ester carboxylesterase
MTRNIYALLVGIDKYPSPVPQLEGCVNDIDAIEEYLNERIDRQNYQPHIVKLPDEKATRQAVIDNFEQHLGKAGSNDVALFYYSGHGSQEPAPPEFWHLEPDRMDETLVCWDSRTSNWDLADKELAYLIGKVAKNNPHIVVILDSCHSGSGTRDAIQKGVRHAPADRRPRDLKDFIFSLSELGEITKSSVDAANSTEEKSSSWSLPQGRHVLLAACRDREVASEYSVDGKQRGAFSYFLINTLNKTSGYLSYRELFKRTCALVRTRIKDQTPQIEATNLQDLDDLPFLGDPDVIKPRDPFFTLKYDGSQWTIDGGAVHGLPQATTEPIRLALYEQGLNADQMRQSSSAVGEAEVLKVLADKSIVKIIPEDLSTDTVLNAVIVSLPLPALGVYFEGESEALEKVVQELQKSGPGSKPSLYVRKVENLDDAQYRLIVRNNEYIITKPKDDRPLVQQLKGYTELNARKSVQNLEHIARWTTVAELANLESKLPSDAIKLQIFGGDSIEITDSHVRLDIEDGESEAPFRIKLTNTYHKRVYCAILDLPEDYSVLVPPLFPQGGLSQGGIWIEPEEENAIWAAVYEGNHKLRDTIPATVPNEMLERGVTEYQDVLKLIVSTAEFDATLLTQDELPPPIKELKRALNRDVPNSSTLNLLMHQVQTRHVGVSKAQVVDEWVTSQVTITTVQPKDTQQINEDTVTDLGFGVTIQQNPGLKASARLATVPQSTRDLGNHLLPPILRDYSQPFQFTASRGVDPGLSVLELQVSDAESSSILSVTSENPLILSIDKKLGENEHVLPVAYDGEFFIPLGRGRAIEGGKTEIVIEQLPDPVTERQKSLGGSIRIFFQKVISERLGLEGHYTKLRVATVAPDETVKYEEDTQKVKAAVALADKIVLYIHGIIGDTESMVPSVRRAKIEVDGQSKPLIEIYDLVLTFDYENLNTHIKDIGKQLKEKLEAVGLVPNHGKQLHIVAHSMGGLVSRSFIEQWGGNQVVQHLFMLGTPNAGSPWSAVQDTLTTALAIGLNSLSLVSLPAAVLGSLVAAIETIDINLDEMHPTKSPFLAELKNFADPQCPYCIIAGNTSLMPVKANNQLQKFLKDSLRRVVEFPFLGENNDIAVTVASIKSVPDDRNPQPLKEEVACDHLSYFGHPAGLSGLANAVARAFGNIDGDAGTSPVVDVTGGSDSSSSQPEVEVTEQNPVPIPNPVTETNNQFEKPVTPPQSSN